MYRRLNLSENELQNYLEKIDTKKIYNAQMINLIGEDISIYRNKKFKENEFFYDYLKKQVKTKRKMGHLTIIEK